LAPDSPESFLPFRAVEYPQLPPFSHGAETPGSSLVLQNANSRPMYLGIQNSFDLLCRVEPDISRYNLIFRCRPDLWFAGSAADFRVRMVEPKIYFPNHSQYHGYCDQFAGGPPDLMKVLFTTYQAIAAYEGPRVVLNGERLLKYWLDRHGVPAAELPFDFKIYRSAFLGMSYEDIPRHSNRFRDP
jgi:hypothetical protein